jgi:hypothetical protein
VVAVARRLCHVVALRLVVRDGQAWLLAVDARQDQDPGVVHGRLDGGLEVAEATVAHQAEIATADRPVALGLAREGEDAPSRIGLGDDQRRAAVAVLGHQPGGPTSGGGSNFGVWVFQFG